VIVQPRNNAGAVFKFLNDRVCEPVAVIGLLTVTDVLATIETTLQSYFIVPVPSVTKLISAPPSVKETWNVSAVALMT